MKYRYTKTAEPTVHSSHLDEYMNGCVFHGTPIIRIFSKIVWACIHSPDFWKVYIDDLLFHGQNDEDFGKNTRESFQICRATTQRRTKAWFSVLKSTVIGTKVPFVGNDVDSLGLNMSQARIKSTIALTQPGTLKELFSFLGLVNYFRHHLRSHSWHSHHLHDILAAKKNHSRKTITLKGEAQLGF